MPLEKIKLNASLLWSIDLISYSNEGTSLMACKTNFMSSLLRIEQVDRFKSRKCSISCSTFRYLGSIEFFKGYKLDEKYTKIELCKFQKRYHKNYCGFSVINYNQRFSKFWSKISSFLSALWEFQKSGYVCNPHNEHPQFYYNFQNNVLNYIKKL